MIDFTSSIATIVRRGECRKWLGAQIEQCRLDCFNKSTTDKGARVPEVRKTPGIAKAKSERAREVREIFAGNYMDYQYRFVEFFVEHLEDVSRAFRGDLQQMMVLAIIGQVKLRVVRDAILAGEDPASLPPERCGIGASRIADVTAIPRQTVRRKLELLEQRGWIQRLDDSTWTLRYQEGVAEAHAGLSDVDRRSIDRVARVFAELEALVSARS